MYSDIFNVHGPRRLPDASGPNAVRSYITNILTTKYDTTPEFAEDVASNRKLGRVHNFLHASPATFDRVFGAETGAVLFETTREDMLADWWNSHQGILGSCKHRPTLSMNASS